MAVFRPFAAVRPLPDYAAQVAALPYDVMSSAEARELAQGNPNSFLHVDKAEIDLDPSIDLYDASLPAQIRRRTAFAMWTPATRTPGLSFWPAAHRPSSTQYWRIGRRRTRRFMTLCRMACGRPFGWWMMIRRLCG